MRGLILFLSLTSVGLAPLSAKPDPSLNASERHLFERIERVTAGGPPSASGIVNAFHLPSGCEESSCFFDETDPPNPSFAEGDLRPDKVGLVFVLAKVRGECIRMDRVVSHFGTGRLSEACSHGGCWYFHVQYDWGIIGFGLENPVASCVNSFVINSHTYQQPRPN